MTLSDKSRCYFEGLRLGDGPSVPQVTESRIAQGFFPAGSNERSYPLIGAFGFTLAVVIEGQFRANDYDFLTFEKYAEDCRAYARSATKAIEYEAVVDHDVSSRRLGTLGFVLNDDDFYVPTSITENISDVPYGTIQVNLSTADMAELDLAVEDRVILQQAVVDGIPDVGEIVEVSEVSASYFRGISRERSVTGGTKYTEPTSMEVRRLEAWWPEIVYRSLSYPPARALAEGGFRAVGMKWAFEGALGFVRRGFPLFTTSVPSGALYGAYAEGNSARAFLYFDSAETSYRYGRTRV